jgi:hypothetical protein
MRGGRHTTRSAECGLGFGISTLFRPIALSAWHARHRPSSAVGNELDAGTAHLEKCSCSVPRLSRSATCSPNTARSKAMDGSRLATCTPAWCRLITVTGLSLYSELPYAAHAELAGCRGARKQPCSAALLPEVCGATASPV